MINSLRLLPVILCAAFICLSVINVAGQTPIREVLKRRDTYNQRLTTLRAEITMVKVDAVLGDGDPTILSGNVIYAKRPGKDALMRLDWKRPDEFIAVVDGEYRVFRRKLKVAYKGSVKELDKTKPEMNPNAPLAFSFLNTSKKELDSRYRVSLLSKNARLSTGVETSI